MRKNANVEHINPSNVNRLAVTDCKKGNKNYIMYA